MDKKDKTSGKPKNEIYNDCTLSNNNKSHSRKKNDVCYFGKMQSWFNRERQELIMKKFIFWSI